MMHIVFIKLMIISKIVLCRFYFKNILNNSKKRYTKNEIILLIFLLQFGRFSGTINTNGGLIKNNFNYPVIKLHVKMINSRVKENKIFFDYEDKKL